jgi:hypothetical protein
MGITWSNQQIKKVDWSNGDNNYPYKLIGKLEFNSPILDTLICDKNNLSELDISNNTELTYLSC